MIDLDPLDWSGFKNLLENYSFTVITESRVFSGWHERISRCTYRSNAYLVEYISGNETWLAYFIDATIDRVLYFQREHIDRETLVNVSKGAVIKLFLQLKSRYCLHASGIRIKDQVILFMGAKGAGKSTTAAYFNASGYPVWCDDYCILEQPDGVFLGHTGETHLKLKSDSINALSISSSELSPMYLPFGEAETGAAEIVNFKTYYRSSNNEPQTKSLLPVKAIFLLQERGKGLSTSVEPADKLFAMKTIMNEIMLREIVSKDYLSLYFGKTKKLVDSVPIYKAQAADQISDIKLLFDAILEEVR